MRRPRHPQRPPGEAGPIRSPDHRHASPSPEATPCPGGPHGWKISPALFQKKGAPPAIIFPTGPIASPRPLWIYRPVRTFPCLGAKAGNRVWLPPGYAQESPRHPVVNFLLGATSTRSSGPTEFVPPIEAAIKEGQRPPCFVVLVNGRARSFFAMRPTANSRWRASSSRASSRTSLPPTARLRAARDASSRAIRWRLRRGAPRLRVSSPLRHWRDPRRPTARGSRPSETNQAQLEVHRL